MTEEPSKASFFSAGESRFQRDQTDNVLFTNGDRTLPVGSMAMTFPLSNRMQMIVLRDENGKEFGILDDIRKLDAQSKRIATDEIERSYFLPRILDISAVSEDLGILTWQVATDRGCRTFDMRGIRKSIRRLGGNRIIIRDVDGNRYEIKDWLALPLVARKHLERYI